MEKRKHKSSKKILKEIIDTKNGNKNIKLLGGASLFNDIGSEMITPVLPFYITALGGGGVAVGLISGLREGLSSLFKLLGGYLSDRTGRRMPYVFLGYLFSIIFRFLLAVVNAWQWVIALVSFERLGKARDAPRDAIILQSTEKRGHGFGIHQAMDTAGGIIGSILVLILFWKLQLGFKTLILIAGAISVLSLLPLAFVKEPKTRRSNESLFSGIKHLDKKLKYFILVAAVFTLGNFGLYMFILLLVKQFTESVAISLLLYVLFHVTWASLTIPFGDLSDKIGRKSVLMLGYILFFVVSLGFIFSQNIWYLTLFFVLYGLVYSITQSNQKAFVSDLAGEMKGTAMGFYQAILGVTTIPAGIIAGYFWNISYILMFKYIAIIALIAVLLLIFVKEEN